MTRRHVGVFTSSRADLGPLGPVIRTLDADDRVTLTVLAAGTHFSPDFGGQGKSIPVSGDSEVLRLDATIGGTGTTDLGETYGRIASSVSRALDARSIDVLVLLGDRWELLAAAGAALIHGVAIAHLHGGETTEGAIDERIRHGVTKLADIHLCATEDSARRIRQLGEQPHRITVTGAPGLDRLADVEPMDNASLEALIGRPIERPLGVVVHHPTTIDREGSRQEAREVLEAAAATLRTVVALYPGADPGTSDIIDELSSWQERHDHAIAVKNLGDDYVRLLAAADVLVGNSSSGIIEAASFELPVVNVGNRQAGRLQPRNVLTVDSSETADALKKATSDSFRRSLSGLVNPYGDGKSAQRIADRIAEIDLSTLAVKPMVPNRADVALDQLTVSSEASLRTTMEAINRGARGIALAVGDDGRLLGTVTDGDIRRALLSGATIDDPLDGHFSPDPITANDTDDGDRVLRTMLHHSIHQVPVIDAEGRLVGLHGMNAVVAADGTVSNRDSVPYGHEDLDTEGGGS